MDVIGAVDDNSGASVGNVDELGDIESELSSWWLPRTGDMDGGVTSVAEEKHDRLGSVDEGEGGPARRLSGIYVPLNVGNGSGLDTRAVRGLR